ncbi:MAG TPA: sigma-54 dependent transcriptional regulator, partial [Spirochaetia bacterium]|nr:sigma-54 dependent transcriptional regulator [Spirochaetia bacterium]
MVKVLFIDDDPSAHRTLASVLPDPYVVVSAYTGLAGIEAVSRERADVVILDINLPDVDGIAVLRRIVARPAAPPVVMLSALSDARLIKEALLGGACDYIVKPFALAELLGTLRTAVRGADARRAAAGAVGETLLSGLLGETAGMQEVKQLVLRYAGSDSPVLIQGESGTGKELVARFIHEASRRRGAPCIAVNCGALPETLLETELFGSEKGAFTDAVSRAGCFERANGGTLFLDEIGDMSPAAQARLLRVIEQKELTRVGGSRSIPLDVRVVSATHRDLRQESSVGRFRQDLFYRLGVLPIRVPPLRDRGDDIPLLAAHFLALLGRPNAPLAPDAAEALRCHGWPGNVRELRSVMERAVLAAGDGTIRSRHLLFD